MPDTLMTTDATRDEAPQTRSRDLNELAAALAKAQGEIEGAIKDLKAALEKDDTAAIKEKSQALAAAAMKMGEEIYSKGQTPEGGPDAAGAPGAGDSDDVVDADFEEVKDDKKSA